MTTLSGIFVLPRCACGDGGGVESCRGVYLGAVVEEEKVVTVVGA